LWLTPRDPEQENLAHEILTRHGAEIIDQGRLEAPRPAAYH
jgi:hypothetical protein